MVSEKLPGNVGAAAADEGCGNIVRSVTLLWRIE